MRRFWLSLSIVILLAACSSAPQVTARRGGSHAPPHAYSTRPPGFPDFVDHSVGREEISIEAMGLVGIPYRWGGNTPTSGFDCSGLVHYVLARAADVNLPRTTADMSRRGESIQPDQIAAGDLVFFNTTGRPHSHVGIYVGKLRFVNAPSTGGTVRIDYLNNPYWAKHFDGIRRVAPPKRPPTPFDAPTWQASAPAAGAPTLAAAGAAPVVSAAPPAPQAVTMAPIARAVPAPAPAQSVAPTAAPLPADIAATSAPPSRATADRFAAADTSSAAAPAPMVAASPPPDPFEPPPPAVSAAQRQALAAGAVSPPVVARAAGPATFATSTASASPAAPTVPTAAANTAPDPIDAAADAFEPPPPTATVAAQRQAEQAQAQRIPVVRAQQPTDMPPPSSAPVQVLRASTAPGGAPAPTQPADDPIARFANSGL